MNTFAKFCMWTGFAVILAIIAFPIGTVITFFIIGWRIGILAKGLHNAALPGSGGVTIAQYQAMTPEEKQALADKSNEAFFAKQRASIEKSKAQQAKNKARIEELVAERKARRGRPKKVKEVTEQ